MDFPTPRMRNVPETEDGILARALAGRDAAERTSLFDLACRGDFALRKRVAALLAACGPSGGGLETPAYGDMGRVTPAAGADLPLGTTPYGPEALPVGLGGGRRTDRS